MITVVDDLAYHEQGFARTSKRSATLVVASKLHALRLCDDSCCIAAVRYPGPLGRTQRSMQSDRLHKEFIEIRDQQKYHAQMMTLLKDGWDTGDALMREIKTDVEVCWKAILRSATNKKVAAEDVSTMAAGFGKRLYERYGVGLTLLDQNDFQSVIDNSSSEYTTLCAQRPDLFPNIFSWLPPN